MGKKNVTPDQPKEVLKTPDHIEAPVELISDTRPALATVTANTSAPALVATRATGPAENPELALYHEQYNRLPDDIKTRCGWETLVARLLANDGEKLKLASAMQGGGELVGIDLAGKVLFKDKGTEPVMFGFDRNNNLIRIYNRDAEQMYNVKKWADYSEIRDQVHKDGYELFPYKGDHDLSDEMKQAHAHTKEPFVVGKNRDEWIFAWLESGDTSERARCALFCPNDKRIYVQLDCARYRGDGRYGAVRLLRV